MPKGNLDSGDRIIDPRHVYRAGEQKQRGDFVFGRGCEQIVWKEIVAGGDSNAIKVIIFLK